MNIRILGDLDMIFDKSLIKLKFSELPIDNPVAADDFFSTFGPGNSLFVTNRPYDRFTGYEELLDMIYELNPQKYKQIHKGTPFYYLAWLSFDLHRFEKGLFYIDAAISEDIRKTPNDWKNQPAYYFLALDNKPNQIARRTIDDIRKSLSSELFRFNQILGHPKLNLDSFIEKFVNSLLIDSKDRTLITAFYVFLLEHEERQRELRLRSIDGGSISPFISHLFNGALIFESLLKFLFPKKDDGKQAATLKEVFNTSRFRSMFSFKIGTSAYSLAEIIEGLVDDSIKTAFSISSKIRNTTGHNLCWDDSLNETTYKQLFGQEINAIFYLVIYCF